MWTSRITWLAVAADLVAVTSGQYSGWVTNQVNTTMCNWQALRSAILKDTVYLDGGYLGWAPGLSDGSIGTLNIENTPLAIMYSLNLTRPFKFNSNITEVLGRVDKFGANAGYNIAPNYFDGALLHNDHEFFLYGGLLTRTASVEPPAANAVLYSRVSQYGPFQPSFQPGWGLGTLPGNMTRYVAFGGEASAPSENKAWYFSGMQAPGGGPVYYPQGNSSFNPTEVSNNFVSLDMTRQQQDVWNSTALPGNVTGRGGTELVWVPVGPQGILVALGGVTFPSFATNGRSLNEEQSKTESPAFMSTIDIYDVASGRWYKQQTTGAPGQLAVGCAVVATAQDYSSYNIYYYGGYDGLHITQDFSDDVWVLSLPSFTWAKVYSGTAAHARAFHKCVMPYPNQMMVIGGSYALKGLGSPKCLDGGMIQIFDLNENKWSDGYDPAKWANYSVPEILYSKIGGNAKGSATAATPSPSGWTDNALSRVFATPYPTTKLTAYYPYASVAGPSDRPSVPEPQPTGGGGLPSWVAPVLGVVLGLIFITAIVVAILLYRRRKLLRAKPEASEGGSDENENGHRILSWIRGQEPPSQKAMTVTSEAIPVAAVATEETESRVASTQPVSLPEVAEPQRTYYTAAEMPDTPLVELMGDTHRRAELSDTGLTPVEIINKHTHFARGEAGSHPSSLTRFSVSGEEASISSHSHSHIAGPVPSFLASSDSASGTPSLTPAVPAELPAGAEARIVSGVSALSESDRLNLRHLSNMSFSSSGGPDGIVSPPVGSPVPVSAFPQSGTLGPMSPPIPVSPPTAEEREAADYLSAGPSQTADAAATAAAPAGTTLRKKGSVFRESAEDLGEKGKDPK